MLEEYLQPKIRQKKKNSTLGDNSVGREEGLTLIFWTNWVQKKFPEWPLCLNTLELLLQILLVNLESAD